MLTHPSAVCARLQQQGLQLYVLATLVHTRNIALCPSMRCVRLVPQQRVAALVCWWRQQDLGWVHLLLVCVAGVGRHQQCQYLWRTLLCCACHLKRGCAAGWVYSSSAGAGGAPSAPPSCCVWPVPAARASAVWCAANRLHALMCCVCWFCCQEACPAAGPQLAWLCAPYIPLGALPSCCVQLCTRSNGYSRLCMGSAGLGGGGPGPPAVCGLARS